LVIDRYLIKEVGYTLLGVFVVLLFIVAVERFVRYLGDVAAGALPVDVVFTLLGLKMLNYVALLLSVAFYLALLLTLTRLYTDNEMTALASGGIGLGQLLRPISAFAVVIAVVVAAFSLYISPWAATFGNQLQERAENVASLSSIAAGRFVESADGDWVILPRATRRRKMPCPTCLSKHATRTRWMCSRRGVRWSNTIRRRATGCS
jgi:lipopolysaccharide export system permease protein